MEVITIESKAFEEFRNYLEEIKSAIQTINQQPATDKWLDNDEVSAFLKVTKRTLQTYRDEGKISFSQPGAKVYYRFSDIEDFLLKYHHKAFKYKR